jgi:hypothetical protein
VSVGRRATIGPVEFIARVVQALNDPSAASAPGTRAVLYTVTGVPELNFVAPDADVTPTPAGGGTTTPPPSGVTTGPGHLATTVRAAITSRSARTAVPPLLRGTTEALTRDLLGAITPEPRTDEGRTARETVAAAGITTTAQLLDADPERLLADVLRGQNAQGLADLLDVAEKSAAATTKAVGDTLVQFATNRRIVSRDDLARSEVAAPFAEALAEALKGTVPPEYVAAAVGRVGTPTH